MPWGVVYVRMDFVELHLRLKHLHIYINMYRFYNSPHVPTFLLLTKSKLWTTVNKRVSSISRTMFTILCFYSVTYQLVNFMNRSSDRLSILLLVLSIMPYIAASPKIVFE